jgi:xanthine dehydrogenase accessory factor
VDGGNIEVFIEIIEPQVPLVIFGAGDDVLPILPFARNLGWHTTVVDTRARPSSIDRFAAADAVLLCCPEEVSGNLALTERSAVVLMTHNYLHDLELLKLLLPRRVRYLGCLGPKRRTERLLLELSGGGVTAGDAYLRQVHAPAGLDIGAETPSEIAFSIIAEIKAVLRGREGGLLRNRKGSIHVEVGSDLVSSTPSLGMNLDVCLTAGVNTPYVNAESVG